MPRLIAVIGLAVFVAIATIASVARSAPVALPGAPAAAPLAWDWPPAAPMDRPPRGHPRLVLGFVVPIGGVNVPTEAQYLPNSPRDYRAGYHEGIDFPAKAGTPVLAAKAGTVIRADTTFTDWSAAERQSAFDAAQAVGFTSSATLDRIRGRQVWVDHGGDVVTRYAHLEAVAPLRAGDVVKAGQVIGAVGSSGFPEGGPHLHFEIRIGEDFYGDGLPLPQLRYAIAVAFR